MADQLTRTESYQYPATHLGHLNPHQTKALEQFKKLCQDKGYYRPAGPNGEEASHDDETLLRYARARKWNPQDAFAQFSETEDWRKENQLDKLYETIDVGEYDQARRLYPQWTGRRDKRGIPVYVFEVSHLNSKNVAAYESSTSKPATVNSKVPPKMLRLFALYENLTNFALPLCSAIPDRPYPETPVSQSNNIVDISHVGLKQFWNLKSHMQDASTLATAHYPETLDRIFIIGAPSFFPTVWGWIKRWFDPITVSKIFILSGPSMKTTLAQYIEPHNIPKKYGGTLDWEFGSLPNLDPVIEKSINWSHPEKQKGNNTFPTGPIKWIKAQNGDLIATAVGSQKGSPRRVDVGSLHPDQSTQLQQSSLGVRQHPDMYRTTSGYSTHPSTPPQGSEELEPPRSESDTPTLGASGSTTGGEAGAISAFGASTTGTQDLPIRTAAGGPREGTSATRYEQEHHTLAHGQTSVGTPNLRSSGDGDKHGVMEPNTVAQAPKEFPVPEVEEPAPTMVEQVQNMAGQAVSAAMAAVGMGGDKTIEETENKIPEDPAVDNAKEKNVEEFLRSKNMSAAAGS